MIGTLGAFGYLTARSLRNQTWARIRRVRNPRYAISALIGGAYFYFFLIHNTSQMPQAIGENFNDMWVVVGTVGLVLFATSWWLFGGDRTTLAFSPAETSFLFTAPLSRRAIIGYKLFRAQLAILLNALIFIFLMRRGIGYLSPGYRAISLWMLFTTLNFHRVGAALVRTSWIEHHRHAWRRNLIPTLVLVTMIAGIAVAVLDGWPDVREMYAHRGLVEAIGAARGIVERAPASYVLWPVHAIVAPVFAMTEAEWLAAVPSALLVLLLHAWWVVRTDAAFEESAIAASQERMRRVEAWRSRRMVAPRPGEISRSTIRLPARGHRAIAIVWKNLLCLRRTMQFRVFLAPLAMATVWGMAFGAGRGPFAALAIGCATLAGLLTFFGPMLLRNDLRQDMQNLLALKVLPLRGRTIVMAEVLSSALPIALTQYLLVLAGAAFASRVDGMVSRDVMMIGLVAGLPFLLAFGTAMVAIQNGAPVLFPGWVRLGTVVGGGMENLGQGVLTMFFILLVMSLLLVPALAIGALVGWLAISAGFVVAIIAGTVAGSTVLAIETLVVFTLLGRALERTEPSEAAAT